MAEYGDEVRQEYGEGDDSLEETTAANIGANNSIIGKMRSSVTSILPNRLSKWFSPSSNNNDSANGSYSNIKRNRSETEVNTPHTRIDRRNEMARRRIEVNEYAEDDDGDGDGYGDELDDDEAAEESNHSDDVQISATSATVQRRRHLNVISPIGADQPPSKRSRMTLDGTMHSPRPLIASTPAITSQRNSGIINNHYGHLNLYSGGNRKELGYNFYASASSVPSLEQQNTAPDIIDLIPIPMPKNDHDTLNVKKINQHNDIEAARSRRTLNIPSTGATQLGSAVSGSILPSLKRQSLSTVKTNSTAKARKDIDIQDYKSESIALHSAIELKEEVLLNPQTYNGSDQLKFQNGAADFEDELRHRSVTDSEPEDADTVAELPTNTSIHSTLKAGMTSQRSASSGLCNMSTGVSRSGSRTSSLGNGLNFYTHLEGRKSLFAGNNLRNRTNIGNPLNSSTLSLNSLSRRQFNASIYGSTSALSDSRLLNTSSPFYKGNTTYGGAAAYSKYTTSLGTHSRLTPTLIRPTSSLSTLSSSSNSIVAGAGISNAHGEQNPAISGTAKTILDILNGFTTPLSEAKKMASNLRQQPIPSISSQTKSKRLTDADLHASRAMRLQQVRTPYMRPAVMLQPKKPTNDAQMPPVRELQVPLMSQLVQMKKLQTLTERSRQITMQKSNNEECSVPTIHTIPKTTTTKSTTTPTEIEKTPPYTLPPTTTSELNIESSVFDFGSKSDSKQQKHVNKIKHKITNPLRAPDIPDESPPIPANLPNIAFPMMTGLPKIDIALPAINKSCNTKKTETISLSANAATPLMMSDPKRIADSFRFSQPVDLKNMPSSIIGIEPSAVNFEFSKPAPLEESTSSRISNSKDVIVPEVRTDRTDHSASFTQSKSSASSAKPTLKTGSVLDALKKPLVLSNSSNLKETGISMNSQPQPLSSFGSQFKKAANDWECDTCMVRNKESAEKCVACDVPRKGGSTSTSSSVSQKPLTITAPITPFAAGFGDQFKKQSDEWECDICMVRNKSETDKCISCETSRKTKGTSLTQTDGSKPFGQNILENSLKSTPAANVIVASDTGFKSMAAAQKASKWECEACMTRNDSSRSKCACCEQPKPGTESQQRNEPSFNFGATAVSKFSFGFGANAPDPAKENKLSTSNSTTNLNSEKSAVELGVASKGFQFGTDTAIKPTQSSSFSFGFQPKSNITQEKTSVIPSSKGATDSSIKAPALSFGIANTVAPKANTTLTFSDTTTKGDELPAASTATSTTPSSTIISTTTSFTPPKVTSFSFGNATAKSTQAGSALTTTKPQEGLAFGMAFQKPATGTVANTATTSSASKLSFPMTMNPKTEASSTTTTTSSVSAPTAIVGSGFSFDVVSTSATSTTTTAKPMFSFGVPSMPSTSTGNVSSSTVSVTTNGGAIKNSTSTSAANVGFGFINSTPTTTAAATKLPFSINSNANTNSPLNITPFTAFGSPKSNPQTTITTATTTTTTAAPAFGSFSFGCGNTNSPKTESLNLFGTITPKTQDESTKPIATAVPIFGNAEPKTTTSNTWPKNTFLFGSPASTGTTKIADAGLNEPPASKAVFGNVKSKAATESTTALINNINASSSIFGNVSASPSTPSFGNNGGTASTVIFGTGSTAPTTNTTNLFGSNNNTTVPQFGTMSSGQTTLGNNSTANTPVFGNTAPVSFGSFGTAAITATATSTTNSEANTQPATTPFTFGAPQTQSTSSGFNFGATPVTAKPAFNFTSTNQPTFNFTGSAAETTLNSAQPFQFGATAAPPSLNASTVFSYGGAPSTEATSNTPFQFNAGSSLATSNIFAPAPTASTTPQAARRKVRIPNRRLPPR